MSDEKLCCPHCGGRSGYNQKVTYKAHRWTAWGEDNTDRTEFVIQSEGLPHCEDCGRSVKKFVEDSKKVF